MTTKTALFRLSVLGSLTSRIELKHGEIKQLITDISKQHFDIPGTTRSQISPRTIERWYFQWRKTGIAGLEPKNRSDLGTSKLTDSAKARLCQLKSENMCRSVNTLLQLMFDEGYGKLPRSTVHRMLKQEALSLRVVSDSPSIERREFEAKHASDIWYSDVMHGPYINHEGQKRKTYLISFMDDASRLLTHSSFYFDEQAISVERVLKEAVMRRGLPKRLIVDNGSAYRSASFVGICARLDIRLIYCRPYEPEGKGKLERWHRTVRAQFLNELNSQYLNSIHDLNDRLHAWIEEIYHQRKHNGLNELSPLTRFRQDIANTRRLGDLAKNIDEIFYHRIPRQVSKVGLIKYEGNSYEVAYEYARKAVILVVDPHSQIPKFIEDKKGVYLCDVCLSNQHKNIARTRQRPVEEVGTRQPKASQVENALQSHQDRYTQGK